MEETIKKDRVECPACGKLFLRKGMKNHIINSAKSEVWKGLESKPHKEYFDNNQIIVDENKFVFKQ